MSSLSLMKGVTIGEWCGYGISRENKGVRIAAAIGGACFAYGQQLSGKFLLTTSLRHSVESF
jgi:hypothetical protein